MSRIQSGTRLERNIRVYRQGIIRIGVLGGLGGLGVPTAFPLLVSS